MGKLKQVSGFYCPLYFLRFVVEESEAWASCRWLYYQGINVERTVPWLLPTLQQQHCCAFHWAPHLSLGGSAQYRNHCNVEKTSKLILKLTHPSGICNQTPDSCLSKSKITSLQSFHRCEQQLPTTTNFSPQKLQVFWETDHRSLAACWTTSWNIPPWIHLK